jgi:addiction module HigA family antidote
MAIRIEDLSRMDFSDVVTGERIPPTPPGVFLKEILDELGLSQHRLAREINVPAMRISYIVNGKRPVTAEMAMRLGLYFGQTPQYWLNLQSRYDMDRAMAELWEKLRHEIAPLQAA